MSAFPAAVHVTAITAQQPSLHHATWLHVVMYVNVFAQQWPACGTYGWCEQSDRRVWKFCGSLCLHGYGGKKNAGRDRERQRVGQSRKQANEGCWWLQGWGSAVGTKPSFCFSWMTWLLLMGGGMKDFWTGRLESELHVQPFVLFLFFFFTPESSSERWDPREPPKGLGGPM